MLLRVRIRVSLYQNGVVVAMRMCNQYFYNGGQGSLHMRAVGLGSVESSRVRVSE